MVFAMKHLLFPKIVVIDDSDCKTAVEYDSDDEYLQLKAGEVQKYNRDHAVATTCRMKEVGL